MNIVPGMMIENIKTGAKYRVIGLDMGFIACVKDITNINADIFKYQIPYIKYNFRELPPSI